MTCEECHVGRYQTQTAPYFAWMGQQMIVISNAAAYVCDVCHHTHYDPQFIDNVNYFIEHVDSLPTLVKQRPLFDDKQGWQSLESSLT